MDQQDPPGEDPQQALEVLLEQAKSRDTNPFSILGLEPWMVQWLPEDDLMTFLKAYKVAIAKVMHPDRSQNDNYTKYLQTVLTSLDELSADKWFFRQSRRTYNASTLASKSEAGRKILEDTLNRTRTMYKNAQRNHTTQIRNLGSTHQTQMIEATKELRAKLKEAEELLREYQQDSRVEVTKLWRKFNAYRKYSYNAEQHLMQITEAANTLERTEEGYKLDTTHTYAVTGLILSTALLPKFITTHPLEQVFNSEGACRAAAKMQYEALKNPAVDADLRLRPHLKFIEGIINERTFTGCILHKSKPHEDITYTVCGSLPYEGWARVNSIVQNRADAKATERELIIESQNTQVIISGAEGYERRISNPADNIRLLQLASTNQLYPETPIVLTTSYKKRTILIYPFSIQPQNPNSFEK